MNIQQIALLVEQLGESFREFRRFGILQHLERSQLAAHDFTAVFPFAPHASVSDLSEALKKFEHEQPLRQVPGLHTARWMPLTGIDPRQDLEKHDLTARPFGLVFAFICDGNVLDVLEEMFERTWPQFDAVLRHCAGYPTVRELEPWLNYFRRQRVRSNYLFRDTRQLDPRAPHLHPSAREIRRALDLRKRFRDFVIKNQDKSAEARRDAFGQHFSPEKELPWQEPGDRAPAPSPGLTLPLTPFERPLEHEGMWIRRTAELARTRARRDARARARAGALPAGLRGAHAKHHGLLEARFHVREDVPQRLRHGIFKPGSEYKAWVRPSNSNMNPRPDWLPDARGIAIKLEDVEGVQLLDRPTPNGLGLPDGRTQDFTLVSHPTFFTRNARDYALLRSFVGARPEGIPEKLGVAASIAAFLIARPRELSIFTATLLRWCRHPLLLEYHSLLPFLVGPNVTAKCSLQPTAATRKLLSSESGFELARGFTGDPTDYLKTALQRSLNALGETPLVFEFALHIAGEEPLPVEDPRLDWSKLGAQRVVVATLTIQAQNATSSQRMASAESMVMTPWHSLADHRPLGSLSRARLTTYLASSQERWNANGAGGPSAGAKSSEIRQAAE